MIYKITNIIYYIYIIKCLGKNRKIRYYCNYSTNKDCDWEDHIEGKINYTSKFKPIEMKVVLTCDKEIFAIRLRNFIRSRNKKIKIRIFELRLSKVHAEMLRDINKLKGYEI